MPIIQIHLLEGRSTEQKRDLVRCVTASTCDALQVRPEQVRIILSEMSQEDYAIAGVLMKDRPS
jgi:4-oxalocrotonate tautomerase